MAILGYPHIESDDHGRPCLIGTRTRVTQIALDHIAHHWDAEEIRRQHPSLSRGQIHGALAYYFDHQQELDLVIREELIQSDNLRRNTEDVTLQTRLRAVEHAT